MHVYLIDGTYELFRAFYGAPRAKGPTGSEIGATRGLMRSLLALLRAAQVTHVACAFDHVIESFRNGLFAGYKTSAGIDPELHAQFPLAERACQALGLVMWPMIEFEADDALATAAQRFASDAQVEQVVICSPDKDLAQCVRANRIVLWDRMRKQELDESAVRAKFGVWPSAIPDWLALVGDAADGFPGVPHWGAKSAAIVLSRFGSLEQIPDSALAWGLPVRGAARLAQSLAAFRNQAELYKRLATLRVDVPLPEALHELEWRGARRAELSALCDELGFSELPSQVPRFAD